MLELYRPVTKKEVEQELIALEQQLTSKMPFKVQEHVLYLLGFKGTEAEEKRHIGDVKVLLGKYFNKDGIETYVNYYRSLRQGNDLIKAGVAIYTKLG